MKKNQPNALIHNQLFNSVLLIGVLMSITSMLINTINDFDSSLNIKWFILLIICFTSYLVKIYKPIFAERTRFFTFVFLILVFMPITFFEPTTRHSIFYTYLMFMLVIVSFLFNGKKRLFLIISDIIVFAVLHTLQYLLDLPQASETGFVKYLDFLFQIGMILILTAFITLRFSNEYARSNANLDILANYDELTGLANRRGFDNATNYLVKHAIKNAKLAFIDIDNFKLLNDNFGHSQGDEALKMLAFILKDNINPNQHVLSRWGGDEFSIIYYGELENLKGALNKINDQFIQYTNKFSLLIKLSMSIVHFSDYKTINEALDAADILLYNEKIKKISQ